MSRLDYAVRRQKAEAEILEAFLTVVCGMGAVFITAMVMCL